jgi:hypothetical protein
MKYIIIGLSLLFLITGCVSIGPPVECTIYEDYGATPENSFIARKISNPCSMTDLITVAAKLPIVEWGEEYAADFDAWAARLEIIIENGVSMSRLRDIVLIEVMKLNAKVGFTLLAVSPVIGSFNETVPMFETDEILLKSLLKHLRTEVAIMNALAR